MNSLFAFILAGLAIAAGLVVAVLVYINRTPGAVAARGRGFGLPTLPAWASGTTVLAIALAAALAFGVDRVGMGAWSYWLYVLIVLGLAWVLAPTHRTALKLVGLVACIAYPLSAMQHGTVATPQVSLPWTSSAPKEVQSECEDGSDREVRLCPVGASGSKPLKSEHTVPSGLRLCYEPEVGVKAERWLEKHRVTGKNRSYFRFIPTSDKFVVVRYRFQESCAGPLTP